MKFAVSILMRSDHPGRASKLWEEQIHIFQAEDLPEAQELAEKVGLSAEHEYISARDELTQWKFERVLGVCEILERDDVQQSEEIFSRYLDEQQRQALSRKPDL